MNNDYKNQYERECYHFYKERGICVKCNSDTAIHGQTLCWTCADKNNRRRDNAAYRMFAALYARERRRIRTLKGLCSCCGKALADGRYKNCDKCRAKGRVRSRRYLAGNVKDISRTNFTSYGRCYFCGSPSLTGLKTCTRHYHVVCKNLVKGRERINRSNHPWKNSI